jgi:hypothetical protein
VRDRRDYKGLNNLFLGVPYIPVQEPSRYVLTDGHFVFDGAERCIEEDFAHAELFLSLISAGQIEIFEQLRLLKTIAKLHDLCTSDFLTFKKLKNKFYQAMTSLMLQADEKLDSYFEEPGEFMDNVSQHYAYHAYHANNYVMYVAREHALLGMVRKFATQLSGAKPYKGDLYGDCSIVLQGPAREELSGTLVGEFRLEHNGPIARVSARERDRFGVMFYDLDQFSNRLSLMIAAYETAVPILQEGLEMKATVEWFLDN